MIAKRNVTLETLLAGMALTAVASFAACGGATDSEPNGSSSGSTSGGTSGGTSSGSVPDGDKPCENGKDRICGCNLPGQQVVKGEFRGPPPSDGGADAGDGDGGAWRCEEECATYHPNGNGTLESCSFEPASAPANVTCTYYVRCVGRRPAELEEPSLATTEARELLSETAKLEAASIGAFVRLARELAHHRAPPALVARAREAAEDERRHTRAMHSLAVRFGADPACRPDTRARSRRVPSLADILTENAVEGCVRETFGALMAHVQALRATDPVVRRTMARIAEDESRHAALAWDIHEWSVARMDATEKQRVEDARRSAVRRLIDEIEHGPVDPGEVELGLIGAVEARTLAALLEERLWDGTMAIAA